VKLGTGFVIVSSWLINDDFYLYGVNSGFATTSNLRLDYAVGRSPRPTVAILVVLG
jgi:hypothetical protein